MLKYLRMITMLSLSLALLAPAITSAEGRTELIWYGQSAFKITTPTGKVLLIDPFITNPSNQNGAKDLAELNKVDLILLTHGHGDHVGNSIEIAKRTGAKLVANYDLGRALVQYGGFPAESAERTHMGFPGGELDLLGGEVRILLTPAVHSSVIEGTTNGPLPGKVIYAGTPGGFVIAVQQGPTIYHTGDTDLFSDMALIGSLNKIDIMLACIGGHFTMGPKRAAMAARLVNPGVLIPMHFGSIPLLKGTPEELAQALAALPEGGPRPPMKTMAVGETWIWSNNQLVKEQ